MDFDDGYKSLSVYSYSESYHLSLSFSLVMLIRSSENTVPGRV